MQEMQVWSMGREDTVEKEMATHSNMFVQEIPETEESGELQSTWSQRVRHDLWTKQQILRSLSSLWFNYVQLLKQYFWGFPGGSEVKVSACNARNLGSIPGSGRSPGEGNGNPLQYSCLENPVDRGAWWATDHGVAKSWARLRDLTLTLVMLQMCINDNGPFYVQQEGNRDYTSPCLPTRRIMLSVLAFLTSFCH